MGAISGDIKQCSKCKAHKDIKEFCIEKSCKDGRSRWCRECKKAYMEKNKERLKQWHRTRYLKNKDRLLAMGKSWRERNKERMHNLVHSWRSKNGTRYYGNLRKYRAKHLDKRCAYQRAREAKKIQAMPIWACEQSIGAIYTRARQLTESTGIPYHVDHIIPLKHPRVCGLHVEHNLQVIPAEVNLKKNNHFSNGDQERGFIL